MRSIRTHSFGRTTSNERGNALVTVVVVISAVLLIASALYITAVGEADLVEYSVDSAKAFYVAEAGQIRARAWLEGMADKGQYPTSASVSDQPLGDGSYDVDVEKVSGLYPWLVEYEITSRAEVDGVEREIVTRIRKETFAQYVYFAHNAANIWFTDGDSLDGRVHINGKIQISGDPWFGMKVTSSHPRMTLEHGSNPIFEGGYELDVDSIPFPKVKDIRNAMKSEAQHGGTYEGKLSGGSAYYEVVLGMSGDGYLSYRSYTKHGRDYRYSNWEHVRIDQTNGVFWFHDRVRIEGTLDGQVTVGSNEDMYITDNILYADSTPGQGPNPGADDILGLISAKNIIVADTQANRNDVEIHAHMMALSNSFEVENYQSGRPRGDLTVWGGFAQKKMGPIGTFYHGYGIVSGYNKDYHFDRNFTSQSPPAYPETGEYIVVDWDDRARGVGS
jgi:hypothetical protein